MGMGLALFLTDSQQGSHPRSHHAIVHFKVIFMRLIIGASSNINSAFMHLLLAHLIIGRLKWMRSVRHNVPRLRLVEPRAIWLCLPNSSHPLASHASFRSFDYCALVGEVLRGSTTNLALIYSGLIRVGF